MKEAVKEVDDPSATALASSFEPPPKLPNAARAGHHVAGGWIRRQIADQLLALAVTQQLVGPSNEPGVSTTVMSGVGTHHVSCIGLLDVDISGRIRQSMVASCVARNGRLRRVRMTGASATSFKNDAFAVVFREVARSRTEDLRLVAGGRMSI